jgi:hypothetical protein
MFQGELRGVGREKRHTAALLWTANEKLSVNISVYYLKFT